MDKAACCVHPRGAPQTQVQPLRGTGTVQQYMEAQPAAAALPPPPSIQLPAPTATRKTPTHSWPLHAAPHPCPCTQPHLRLCEDVQQRLSNGMWVSWVHHHPMVQGVHDVYRAAILGGNRWDAMRSSLRWGGREGAWWVFNLAMGMCSAGVLGRREDGCLSEYGPQCITPCKGEGNICFNPSLLAAAP